MKSQTAYVVFGILRQPLFKVKQRPAESCFKVWNKTAHLNPFDECHFSLLQRWGLGELPCGKPPPKLQNDRNVTRPWRPRISTIALFSRCRRKVSVLWKGAGEREVGMKFWMSQYANILEVDLDLEDASRILMHWCPCETWPRVAPIDPTWCLPVNAYVPRGSGFLSFLPSQFLKEGEILKGYLPSWKTIENWHVQIPR